MYRLTMFIKDQSTLPKIENIWQQLVFPSVIIFIGLLTIVGFITKSSPLILIGLAGAAGPLPIPFIDVWGRQENFAHTYILIVEDGDRTYTINANSNLLPGPHKFKVSIMLPIIMAPSGRLLFQNALQFMICKKSNLITEFPLPQNEILSVLVRIRGNNGNITSSSKLVCSN